MNADPKEKQRKVDSFAAQAIVLLERQYLLLSRLVDTNTSLRNFEKAVKVKEQALDHVLDVYNYAFALIDHLARYHKIAFSIPRLNHKAPEYRALNASLEEIKNLRDQIQHINNVIENEYTGPLLGAVCWIDSNEKHQQYIASFHDLGRQRTSYGIVFDTQKSIHIQEFVLVYNEKYYDLGKAIEAIHVFNQYIKLTVKIEVGGKEYDAKDHFLALTCKIDLPAFQVEEKN